MSSKIALLTRNSRITTVFFGVVLLCFLWAGLYYKVQTERQLEVDNAFKETANYARTFEEHTVRTLKGLDLIALSVKQELEKEGLGGDLIRLVSEERFAGQPFILLGVLNEYGDLIANNSEAFVRGINNSDREFFYIHRTIDSGKLFIGKPVEGRGSGKMSIQLSRRINKPDGSFGGVVVVSADPNYFAEYYKAINLGEDSSVMLVGRDNIVRVRRSGNEVSIGTDFRYSIVMKKVRTSDVGAFIAPSPIDNIGRIYSYRALREYPLVVVTGVSEKQALQDYNQRVTGYYWFVGTMSGVIILFVFAMLGGIERRKKMSHELEVANLSLTSANETMNATNEEITAMNAEIEALNQNLAMKNEELERRVAQRTAEVTNANKVLIARNIELEKARHVQRRNAEIQTVLREIAETAVALTTLEELYVKVHQAVGRVLPAEYFLVNLLDEATDEIVVPFHSEKSDFVPQRRPVDKGMTEYIMRLGQSVLLTPADMAKLRETKEYTLEQTQKVQVRQYLGAPLIDSAGKAFGMISSLLLDDDRTFQPDDIEMISIVAAQLSIAIERKRAEEKLVESEARYKAVIEQAPEAVLLCDPDSGAIMEANSRFTELLGYSLQEENALNLFELIVDEPSNIRADMDVVTKTGRLSVQRRLFIHRKGRAVYVERAATKINYGGRSLFVMTLRDVSNEVRQERELMRDAQQATRVQNALLSAPASSEYLDITTIFRPIGYVGGDLYFMDWRYEGRLLRGYLIDATGHGMGTALQTASLHVLLREVNERDLPLSDAMRWLNWRAVEYFDEATYAATLGFELDLETRQLRWVCAGIPRIWVSTATQQGVLECPGMCLGIRKDETFDTHTLPLAVGDSLYFMTDGLPALLTDGTELPLDRYPKMVALLRTLSVDKNCRDDATAICIQVRALPESLVRQDGWPRILRFTGYGDYQRLKGEIGKIITEVTEQTHSLHEVAVHEALANAMECRDGVARQQKAQLRFNRVGKWFIVRVKTSRIGFAGNAILRRLRSHPEDMFSFGEDAAMGRGIPMMLSIADKMTYNSEGTEVLLAWKLPVKS